MTTVSDHRQVNHLSRFDRAILALHAVAAASFGVYGFVSATDPGWRDLQRLLILMLLGLWAGGIIAMGVLARRLPNPWIRASILLAGPFIGILLLVGTTTLRSL